MIKHLIEIKRKRRSCKNKRKQRKKGKRKGSKRSKLKILTRRRGKA